MDALKNAAIRYKSTEIVLESAKFRDDVCYIIGCDVLGFQLRNICVSYIEGNTEENFKLGTIDND